MQYIIDKAEGVLEKFGGRNIFETAENAGVNVWYRTLGGLKGFYICENGSRYIVINNELDNVMKSVVCAHELGHDTLHRELSVGGIRENTLFLSGNRTEREANLFAACVLISDDDILDNIEYCGSFENMASTLNLPPELIKYKIEALNFKGYSFNSGEVGSDFLKY